MTVLIKNIIYTPTARSNQFCRRFFSNFEKIALFNQQLMKLPYSEEMPALRQCLGDISPKSEMFSVNGIQFLNTLPNILARADIKQGSIGFDQENWWSRNQNRKLSISSLPYDSEQFRLISNYQIAKIITALAQSSQRPVSLSEIGCLTGQESFMLSKHLAKNAIEVSSICGLDLSRQSLIAASCANMAWKYTSNLHLLHADATKEINYHFLSGIPNNHFILNRVISAIPISASKSILNNVSSIMSNSDYAFINFTIIDQHSQQAIERLIRRNSSEFKVERCESHIDLRGVNGEIRQVIFNSSYAEHLLINNRFSIKSKFELNEYEMRKAHRHLTSHPYHNDSYTRSLYFLVKREKPVYYIMGTGKKLGGEND